jgi:hypothetical protein
VLVWSSRDVYQGIGQSEASAAMPAQDMELYLQALEKQNEECEKMVRPLLSKRREKIWAGESIDDLLTRLFELKERQRRIRQQINNAKKVRNAINLSPCFIDYVVNFGMAGTEQPWRDHLLKDGRLGSPVVF